MAKIEYVPKNFSATSRKLISQCEPIIAEYAAQGFMMTLRQVYYQCVARGYIPNKDSEYKRLGSVINDARLAGLLDWDYLEDRTRNLAGNQHWDSPKEIVDAVARSYRNELWDTQEYRPEIWVEKEALAGVIERTARSLDVDYFSCRGYASQSEMQSAGRRLRNYFENGQKPVIIHLGDHDPSGIDMSRDIQDRLQMFACGKEWPGFCAYVKEEWADDGPSVLGDDIEEAWQSYLGEPFPKIDVRRIALNMPQIRQYNPPPNPAKLTDSRCSDYIRRFGDESWELDALDPATLDALIREAIEPLIDQDKWDEAYTKQELDRKHLTLCSDNWAEVAPMIEERFSR